MKMGGAIFTINQCATGGAALPGGGAMGEGVGVAGNVDSVGGVNPSGAITPKVPGFRTPLGRRWSTWQSI